MERKGKTNLLQSLFFITLILLAGFVFLHSSVFEIRNIEVKGNKLLAQDKIIELSGLTLGTNIFKQNFQKTEEKIKLNPMVKTVILKRHFPSTVELDIVERQALALIPVTDGFIQVDFDGYYLNKLENTAKINQPYITGIKNVNGAAGKKIVSDKLAVGLAFLAKMPASLKNEVSEINVSDEDNVVLYTIGGAPVRLGDNERITKKVKMLTEILSKLDSEQVQYIDLSISKPVIKYLESERTGEE